jgi:hypothetical protein
MEENEKKERISDMSKIVFPNHFENEARSVISQMMKDGLNCMEIPDSDGQVVIREKNNGVETLEFDERVGESDIIMVPIKIKIGDTFETFFVCSR